MPHPNWQDCRFYFDNVASAQYFDSKRIEELTRKAKNQKIETANLASVLEYYNLHKYLRAINDGFDRQLRSMIFARFNHLIKTGRVFRFDKKYSGDFLELAVLSKNEIAVFNLGYLKQIHPFFLIRNKAIVSCFHDFVFDRINESDENFELILSNCLGATAYYIPDGDYTVLCKRYINSPIIHPDYLKIIYSRPERFAKYAKITQKMRIKALKRYKNFFNMSLTNKSGAVIEYVAFTSRAEYDKRINNNKYIGKCFPIFIDEDWISHNANPESILNYICTHECLFAHDRILLLTNNSNQKSITDVFGINNTREYGNLAFDIKLKSGIVFMFAIQKVLNRHKINIEKVIAYYFDKYLPSAHDIKFRSINVPGVRYRIEHKNTILCNCLEQVLKNWKTYCERGYIDLDHINMLSQSLGDNNWDSLNTYYYSATSEGKIINNILFSENRLPLLGIKSTSSKNLALLLLRNGSISLLSNKEIIEKELSPLVKAKILKKEGNLLKLTSRNNLKILTTIWYEQSINPNHFSEKDNKTIADLEKRGILRRYKSLLSEEEQAFVKYALTNDLFDNNLALRNKYSHGVPVYEDKNRYEFDNALILLAFLVIIIKMDDDLNYARLKEGKELYYMISH